MKHKPRFAVHYELAGSGMRGSWANTDQEMRAIWHPIITVRAGDDLEPLLQRTRPFTVVKDTSTPTH